MTLDSQSSCLSSCWDYRYTLSYPAHMGFCINVGLWSVQKTCSVEFPTAPHSVNAVHVGSDPQLKKLGARFLNVHVSLLLFHQDSTLACPRMDNMCPQWVWIYHSHFVTFLLKALHPCWHFTTSSPSWPTSLQVFPYCPVNVFKESSIPCWWLQLTRGPSPYNYRDTLGHFRKSWVSGRAEGERDVERSLSCGPP